MPSTRTICYYAMYVIGEVESNWDWTSVNYNDPITIGMMQWYGTRAAALLNRVKDEMPAAYVQLASSLRSDLESHVASAGYWDTRYLTKAEGNSIITVFKEEQNHVIQENQAIADFEGYIATLEGWGMSQSYPKPLIFAMSMYHQSPASAGQVIATAGGSADLDRIYGVCMNHGVLGQYRNRYNTVYQRLKDWDGESNPPDFGQSGDVDTTPGGNTPGISTEKSKLGYIIQNGDTLILYGRDEYAKGVIFYPASGQVWINGYNANGTDIGGGNEGGGSESGSEAQNAICELYRSWLDRFAYSQGAGRLDPISSGYGDCSSTVWFAYQQVAGIDVGTWTGAMAGKGTKIASGYSGDNLPIEDMEPADLVLIMWNGWNSSFDHVELYMGNNELWGHGGPDYGPDQTTTDARNYPRYMYYWEVRRYL
jgi:hypothetical protein